MPNSGVSLLSNRLLASEDCDGEVLYLSEPFSAGLWAGLSTHPCGTPVVSVCCVSGVTSSFTLQLWCLPFCISPFTRLSALLSTNRSFFGGLSRSLPPSRKPLKMPGISARILLDSSRGSFASSAEGSSSVLLAEGDPALLPSISFPAFTWEGTSEGCSPCAAAGVGLVSGLFWQVGAFLGSRLGPELKQLSSFAAAITELGSFMSASHQESNNRESPANSDWPFWTSRPCLAISSWDGGVSSCPLQGIMGEGGGVSWRRVLSGRSMLTPSGQATQQVRQLPVDLLEEGRLINVIVIKSRVKTWAAFLFLLGWRNDCLTNQKIKIRDH